MVCCIAGPRSCRAPCLHFGSSNRTLRWDLQRPESGESGEELLRVTADAISDNLAASASISTTPTGIGQSLYRPSTNAQSQLVQDNGLAQPHSPTTATHGYFAPGLSPSLRLPMMQERHVTPDKLIRPMHHRPATALEAGRPLRELRKDND